MHQMITKAIVIGMKCAEFHHNHSACAGKKGLGGAAPQQAKCKRCYLCPACYYAPGMPSEDHGNGLLKKLISFSEIFGAGNPSKTVISGKHARVKTTEKPYAATLSEVFKT